MKNWLKRGIALLIAMTLAIPCVNVVSAQAAKKPSVVKKMTIGTGGYMEGRYAGRYVLEVSNPAKGASYSFVSSNKKVVTVKKKGTVGYLTGVAAGTAKITVKQTLKKKTTTVGVCTVKVKKASLVQGSEPLTIGRGKIGAYYDLTYYAFGIAYLNYDAEYEFISSDENLIITLAIGDWEEDWHPDTKYASLGYIAKKPGTYKVTVKEKYKNKTRTVGTANVTVENIEIADHMTLFRGEERVLDGWSFFQSCLDTDSIFCEFENPAIAAIEEVENEYGWKYKALVAKAVGKTTLTYYFKEADGSKGIRYGSTTLEVIDPHVTGIVCSTDTLKGDVSDYCADISFQLKYDMEGDFDYHFSDGITVTSSDFSVAEPRYDSYYDHNVSVYFYSAGTAVVTISYGEFSHNITVTVTDEEY